MRTIYFGHNPDYLLACHEETELLAVFWHKGKGNLAQRTERMLDHCRSRKIVSINHFRPDASVRKIAASLEPDLMIVGEYHFIIPRDIFTMPPLGTINMHGAPLPRYRGANPINWMVINGETEGAVTCHYLAEGLDDGDIIGQYSFPISDTETAYDVRPKIEATGRRLLVDVLRRFKKEGRLTGTPQDESQALYTPPRKPKDGLIDWDQSPKRIYDFVRALTRPYPGAFASVNGKKVYLWKVEMPGERDEVPSGAVSPGTVMAAADGRLQVVVKDGTVTVLEWQTEGGEIRAHDVLGDTRGLH